MRFIYLTKEEAHKLLLEASLILEDATPEGKINAYILADGCVIEVFIPNGTTSEYRHYLQLDVWLAERFATGWPYHRPTEDRLSDGSYDIKFRSINNEGQETHMIVGGFSIRGTTITKVWGSSFISDLLPVGEINALTLHRIKFSFNNGYYFIEKCLGGISP